MAQFATIDCTWFSHFGSVCDHWLFLIFSFWLSLRPLIVLNFSLWLSLRPLIVLDFLILAQFATIDCTWFSHFGSVCDRWSYIVSHFGSVCDHWSYIIFSFWLSLQPLIVLNFLILVQFATIDCTGKGPRHSSPYNQNKGNNHLLVVIHTEVKPLKAISLFAHANTHSIKMSKIFFSKKHWALLSGFSAQLATNIKTIKSWYFLIMI